MQRIPAKLFLFSSSILLCGALTVQGCGQWQNDPSEDYRNPSPKNLTQIYFNLSGTSQAVTYTAAIDTCGSGYSNDAITNATQTIIVPLGDTDCRFRLKSLAVDSITFSASGSEAWETGDVYFWANGTSKLRLAVNDVLDPLIQAAQSVGMSYSVAKNGDDTPIAATTNASTDISEESTIDLEIADVDVSVTNGGAGQFTYSLECDATVAGELCNEVDMSTLKSYMRVDDGSAVNIESCISEVSANGSDVTPFASSTAAPNGGASTVQHTGPAPMYKPENRNLILLVSDASARCKYYKVTVTVPQS